MQYLPKIMLVFTLMFAVAIMLSAIVNEAKGQTKPHFVLLHGAFHTGHAWNGVIKAFKKQGYTAEAPTMPGHGKNVDRKGVAFADYEKKLLNTLSLQTRPVILVGHSAAGVLMQATAVEHLAAVVFHNAFIMQNGSSMIESIPPEIASHFREAAAASNDKSLPVDAGFVRNILMAGESEQDKDRVLAELVPQPFAYYLEKVKTDSFNRNPVPRFVLLAKDDQSMPMAAWLGMAELLGKHEVVEISGGHEVLYTNPEALADGLVRIAETLH